MISRVKNWFRAAGVTALAALSTLTTVLAEDGNQTVTQTINWSIDPAPLINLVVALLPAVLVIIIIKAILGSISGFARFTKLGTKISTWFKANYRPIFMALASLGMLAFFVFGIATTPTVAAQTSLNLDISGLMNLILALLPLIIILVIMKAIMQAFSGVVK